MSNTRPICQVKLRRAELVLLFFKLAATYGPGDFMGVDHDDDNLEDARHLRGFGPDGHQRRLRRLERLHCL